MIYKTIDIGSHNSANIHQIAAFLKNVGSEDLGLSESCQKWIFDLSDFCFMKQEAADRFGSFVAEELSDFDCAVIYGPYAGLFAVKKMDNERLWDAWTHKLSVWKFDREKSAWVENKVTLKLEKI